MIGSGSFITAPVITENGDPIVDPITLQEAQAAKELYSGGQQNGNPGWEKVKEHDKRIIQWKLSLHQIGRLCIQIACTCFLSCQSMFLIHLFSGFGKSSIGLGCTMDFSY